jgi:fructose-1,6-bisphosphatase/inositol monophosphatase family enzyme
VREVVVPLAGTEAGQKRHRVGAGGDTTLEVDRVAEIVAFAELATTVERGEQFSVLSEEAGHLRRLRAEPQLRRDVDRDP